ncbi:sulfatase-like hydrolase/transferase [Urechidicola vernalis]|uniref:Sulfatase-like hydrolase/transferase n=1 Tax=Urechidicola vernalis TaxID=3075600 RepID=A0ABU2Y0Y7_9FLAO|nr:sulfatase-like hydrolase/transferase [Urechidicola sp. P050]MDT0551842.1 sulfatase-like hydrolase/transferase [Urechidicola sp. P050]
MKNNIILILLLVSGINFQAQNKPNLVIIHTDEHNLRTLGAYRATMSKEQGQIWGEGNIVETPNIDRIANEGAIALNWYAPSPVCTPSRASMVSGLYPVATGSPVNDMPLKDEVVTFAQILKDNGYATAYVGKWHLDGEGKPGFAPERKFGFTDNRYMFNRGHWKILGENDNGPFVDQEINKNGGGVWDHDKVDRDNFTTDFLVDKSLEIIERDKNKPFCLMLSLPDPHGPDQVRAPYDTMYKDMKFEVPLSATKSKEQIPGWVNLNGKKNIVKEAKLQRGLTNYFGMVKNIDDNVGRILSYLKENNLEDNTIVVFTSDHGDLYGEHGKLNKGLPYEMSARVAFMLRYPGAVKAGKSVEKALTMVDFAPTILGLMNIDQSDNEFHGIDASKDFSNTQKEVKDNTRIVYLTNAGGRWVAAVNSKYKLVLSPSDMPWLFDLEKDPNEMTNQYNNLEYKEIAIKLEKELYAQMEMYKEPLDISKLKK